MPLIDFVNPDEVVALGAAIQANLQLLHDEDQAGTRTIPQAVRGQFSGHDGELIKVSNITTHSLGVVIWDHALEEEKVHAMIHRSTRIPASVTKSFGLSKDNLTNMRISGRGRREQRPCRNAAHWGSAKSSCPLDCPAARPFH